MHSFKSIYEGDIQFENIKELFPEKSSDIESNEITAGYIYIGEHPYEVAESTYNKICEMKGIV